MKKKIVAVHLLNDFSGSPLVLSNSLKTAQDAGHEIVLITSDGEGFLSDLDCEIRQFKYRWSANKFVTLLHFLLTQLVVFFKLLKYHKEDVMIYVNTLLPFGAAIAGYAMKKKVIYHIHETSVKPKLLKNFLKHVAKITATRIIYVSHFLEEAEGIDKQREKVVYNSLAPQFMEDALSHEYTINTEDMFSVLMACSLKKYKGVEEFLKVAVLCPNIQFNLILNSTPTEIDSFFSDDEVPENVKLFPAQSEMNQWYKKTSLLLNLTLMDGWAETFGMTILEAMSFGIPCIVPPVGGPVELVDDGINGYCIDSKKTEKIANTINELVANRELLQVFSNSARQKSLQFSPESFNKNILEVIESL